MTTKRPIRLGIENGQMLWELLADLRLGKAVVELRPGEVVGRRLLTAGERTAVDELEDQLLRALRSRSVT
jgi:hypothetical protein